MLSPLNQSLVRSATEDVLDLNSVFGEAFVEDWVFEEYRLRVEDRLERLIEEVEKAK